MFTASGASQSNGYQDGGIDDRHYNLDPFIVSKAIAIIEGDPVGWGRFFAQVYALVTHDPQWEAAHRRAQRSRRAAIAIARQTIEQLSKGYAVPASSIIPDCSQN